MVAAIRVAVIALVLLLGSGVLRAEPADWPPDLLSPDVELEQALFQGASVVAVGRVVCLESYMVEERREARTAITIAVDECVKGECLSGEITTHVLGGIVDGKNHWTRGHGPPELGQRYLFRLRSLSTEPDLLWGGYHAANYEIDEDGTVVRKGVTLDVFLDAIRELLERRVSPVLLRRSDAVAPAAVAGTPVQLVARADWPAALWDVRLDPETGEFDCQTSVDGAVGRGRDEVVVIGTGTDPLERSSTSGWRAVVVHASDEESHLIMEFPESSWLAVDLPRERVVVWQMVEWYGAYEYTAYNLEGMEIWSSIRTREGCPSVSSAGDVLHLGICCNIDTGRPTDMSRAWSSSGEGLFEWDIPSKSVPRWSPDGSRFFLFEGGSFSAGDSLCCRDRSGELLWSRSVGKRYGAGLINSVLAVSDRTVACISTVLPRWVRARKRAPEDSSGNPSMQVLSVYDRDGDELWRLETPCIRGHGAQACALSTTGDLVYCATRLSTREEGLGLYLQAFDREGTQLTSTRLLPVGFNLTKMRVRNLSSTPSGDLICVSIWDLQNEQMLVSVYTRSGEFIAERLIDGEAWVEWYDDATLIMRTDGREAAYVFPS